MPRRRPATIGPEFRRYGRIWHWFNDQQGLSACGQRRRIETWSHADGSSLTCVACRKHIPEGAAPPVRVR